MEEKTVRVHLQEVRQALKKNEEERDVLLALLKGYEAWLRLRGSNGAVTQLPLTEPKAAATAPKGTRSFRSAVLEAVRGAHGEPLHAREILRRALAMGARTAAKQPEAITDLMCYSLKKEHPMAKVDPRTWAWIGEAEGHKPLPPPAELRISGAALPSPPD